MNEWTQQEIEQTLEEIKRRSMTDVEFRDVALTDAKAAIAKVNPKPVPAGFNVHFADNSGATKTVVLPDLITSDELSDAELEEVAGGDNNIKIKIG
jgi:hypothetical protein